MTALATAFVRLRVDDSGVKSGAASAGASAGSTFGRSFSSTAGSGIARDAKGRFIAGTGGAAKTAGTSAGKTFGTGFRSSASRALRGIAGPLFATFGTYAVANLVKSSVQLEAAYSTTMRQIAVATDAPKRALRGLDDLAMQLGADTVFSTNDAAQAMLQLAKGGLRPAQIEAGVLSDTLTLASAGELDLNTAANTVVKGMGAFKLSARDASEVTTALAGAANASSSDVSELTQALSQAGGVAHSSGLSIEETTGILGLFADNAIQGSDAGTSLRTMLLRLVPQSDEARDAMKDLGLSFVDSNGNFVDAEQIAQRLQKAFGNLTQAQRNQYLTTIFGQDAIRGANALIDSGAAGLRKYIAASKDQTNAEKLAQAGMSGTKGALEQLSGSWENAKLQLGQGLAPVIRSTAGDLTEFLNTHDVEAWTREFVGGLVDLGGELKPLVVDILDLGRDALPVLTDAGGTFLGVAQDILPVLDKAFQLFDSLPGPVKDLAITIAAVKFTGLWTGLETTVSKGQTFIGTMRNAETRTARLMGVARQAAGIGGLALLADSFQHGNDEALTFIETIGAGAAIGFGFGGGVPGALFGAAAGSLVVLARQLTATGDAAEEAEPPIGNYVDTLNQLTGAATRATRAEVARTLQSRGLLTTAKQLGIDTSQLVDAVLGQGGATKSLNAQLKELAGRQDEVLSAELKRGHNMPEATALAAEYGDKVRALTAAFHANRQQLSGLSKDQRLQAEAVTGTRIDLEKYHKAILDIPREARTQIRALGTDVTKQDLRDINEQFKGFSNEDFQAFVHILGLDQANSGLRETKSWLDTIDGRVARSYVINTVTERHLITGAPQAMGSFRPSEFRTGGQGPVLWNETGKGESYISHDPALRDRSLAILAKTAQVLGVRTMAAGDVFHIGGVPQLPDQWAQIRDLLQILRSGDIKADRRDRLLGRIHDTADKMRSEVKDELQDARGDLRNLLQSQRQLEGSISQSFQTVAFGEGAPSTARELFTAARAQVNDAKLFRHVLRVLKSKGANPSLLSALAQAGPGAIVQAQALAGLSRQELNRYQRTLGAGRRAAGDIGDFIGQQVFGGRVRDARQEFHEMRRAYEKLDHRLDQLPDKVGHATAKALDGTAVKMDGRKVGELVGRHGDRVDRGG